MLCIHAMPSSVTCISTSQHPFLVLFLIGHWILSSYPDYIQKNHVFTTLWGLHVAGSKSSTDIWGIRCGLPLHGSPSMLVEAVRQKLGRPKQRLAWSTHSVSHCCFIFSYCYKEFEHSQSAMLHIASQKQDIDSWLRNQDNKHQFSSECTKK